MEPILGAAPTPRTGLPAPPDLRRAAEAFEVAFLSEMLRTTGLTGSPDGDFDPGPFATFLADAHARALVARGGLGLADHIERRLAARTTGDAG